MRKYSNIKALFEGGSERLTDLKDRLHGRSRVLELVIAALPDELATVVASAGVDRGRLTLGAVNAAWASRLRYLTEPLRQRVGEALGVEISTVRVKVVTALPVRSD